MNYGMKNTSGKCGELLFLQKCLNRPQIDFLGLLFHEISFFALLNNLSTACGNNECDNITEFANIVEFFWDLKLKLPFKSHE